MSHSLLSTPFLPLQLGLYIYQSKEIGSVFAKVAGSSILVLFYPETSLSYLIPLATIFFCQFLLSWLLSLLLMLVLLSFWLIFFSSPLQVLPNLEQLCSCEEENAALTWRDWWPETSWRVSGGQSWLLSGGTSDKYRPLQCLGTM